MIPNPIHKVLSSIRENDVQALLMGGQACVLYGAAEFSRDTSPEAIARTLREEKDAERARDQACWQPLKEDLARLRRRR